MQAERARLARNTDVVFAGLMVVQWIAGILAAFLISPRTWIGATSHVHTHVWAAVLLGGVLAAGPVFMVWRFRGHVLTRHVIAAAQMAFSALLIHLMGGRIETHFHVFVSIAFLAFYRDIGVLLTATVVIAADHCIRGLFWPESVFGTLDASNWLWLEHAAWVVFEDLVLVVSVRRGLADMRENAEREAGIEQTVEERTHELHEALARAEEANRCKTAFLANMSHEIRTPMTAILGYTDVVEEAKTPSEQKDALETIRRNGRHLVEIINEILDLSKLDASEMRVEQIECYPLKIVADVVTTSMARAAAKGVVIEVEVAREIPERIVSDPTRLRQVLLNLVGNAVKFTRTGSVQLVLSCDRDAELMRFAVIDTGVGLDEADAERLFQPFQQSDNSMARRFGGTGLGLSISRELARLLGGDIKVRSEVGTGATFVFTCATGVLDDVSMLAASPERAKKEAAPAQNAAQLEGLRILVAEDGPDNQRLIRFMLKKAGADVTMVENGRLALEAALEQRTAGTPFDVIFMDMQMPEMDGYTATRTLRDESYAGPIIALTAHAMSGDRERCMEAGCDEFATKPIDRKQLITLAEEWACRKTAA